GTLAGTIFREGEQTDPNTRGTLVNFDDVTPGHFETMRIPLLSGRDFTDFDRENTTPAVIVNEAMAKMVWPGQEPLGKRFSIVTEPRLLQVVGVVGTTIIGQLGEDPPPIAYIPMRHRYSPAPSPVVRATGNSESILGAVRTTVPRTSKTLTFTNGKPV